MQRDSGAHQCISTPIYWIDLQDFIQMLNSQYGTNTYYRLSRIENPNQMNNFIKKITDRLLDLSFCPCHTIANKMDMEAAIHWQSSRPHLDSPFSLMIFEGHMCINGQ
jgi:hypothetical protein